jgi:hypothetical protein
MAVDHVWSKSFGEDSPPASDSVAAEAPRQDQELDASACQRQIRHASEIVAMHTPAGCAARRA